MGIRPTQQEMVHEFCDWNEDLQAEFFNQCGLYMGTYGPVARQMIAIGKQLANNRRARQMVEAIGDEALAERAWGVPFAIQLFQESVTKNLELMAKPKADLRRTRDADAYEFTYPLVSRMGAPAAPAALAATRCCDCGADKVYGKGSNSHSDWCSAHE